MDDDKDDEPYCHACGNDDPRQLACEHTPASGPCYRCKVCDHTFSYQRKTPAGER